MSGARAGKVKNGGRMDAGKGGAAVLLACLGLLAGCRGQERGKDDIPSGPAPSYTELARAYNARVARLEAIQGTLDLVVTGTDKDGNEQKDQGEGNLTFVRPSKVALRVDKVSQTYFWLGSDDARFWWFDLHAQEKVAVVGTHAAATPEQAAHLGLPVHPLDLLELAGVVPLPETSSDEPRWARGGGAVVALPGRWGVRRLTIEPTSGEARSVELEDASGRVVVRSDLSRYENVPVRGDAAANPRIATRIVARVPSSATSIEIVLHNPKNPGVDRIKPGNFDLADLKERFAITREVEAADLGRAGQGGP